MALNPTALSAALKSALEGVFEVVDDVELKKLTNIIAEEVLNHIVANGVVTTTVIGGSSAGVHSGVIS